MKITIDKFDKKDFLKMLQTEVGHLAFAPIFSQVLDQVLDRAFSSPVDAIKKVIDDKILRDLNGSRAGLIPAIRELREFIRVTKLPEFAACLRANGCPNTSGATAGADGYMHLSEAKNYVESLAKDLK